MDIRTHTLAEMWGLTTATTVPVIEKCEYRIERFEGVHKGGFCRIEFTDEVSFGNTPRKLAYRAAYASTILRNTARFLTRKSVPNMYLGDMVKDTLPFLAHYTESACAPVVIRRDGTGPCVSISTFEAEPRELARQSFRHLETAWKRSGVGLESLTLRLGRTVEGRLILTNLFDHNDWSLRLNGSYLLRPENDWTEETPECVQKGYETVSRLSGYLE